MHNARASHLQQLRQDSALLFLKLLAPQLRLGTLAQQRLRQRAQLLRLCLLQPLGVFRRARDNNAHKRAGVAQHMFCNSLQQLRGGDGG